MDRSTSEVIMDEGVVDYSSTVSATNSVQLLKKNQLTALESLASIMLREIESLKRTEESAHVAISSGSAINLYDEVQNFEASLIRAALIRAKGVQKAAAELLGVKVTTLNVKIKRHNITLLRPEEAD